MIMVKKKLFFNKKENFLETEVFSSQTFIWHKLNLTIETMKEKRCQIWNWRSIIYWKNRKKTFQWEGIKCRWCDYVCFSEYRVFKIMMYKNQNGFFFLLTLTSLVKPHLNWANLKVFEKNGIRKTTDPEKKNSSLKMRIFMFKRGVLLLKRSST